MVQLPDSILNLPNDARMLDAIRAGLGVADDVRIAVAFTRCSGLGLIYDDLRSVAARGGSVKLLTSTYQSITQPEALEALLSLDGVSTKVQSGSLAFHAKFWWFASRGRSELWAGSSNLTKGGIATNLEWNVRRADRESIELTKGQFEALWKREDTHPISPELIREYRRVYRESVASLTLETGGTRGDAVPVPKPNAAQSEALERLASLRSRGVRRAAVIAATGVGKTYLAAFDVRQSGAKSVLYVSHRLEHLHQARATFSRVLPERTLGIVGGGEREIDASIVFASIASIDAASPLLSRAFDYLVVDEFHHVEAPSYGVLRRIREESFLLGLTATPERQDGHDVLSWCDWNVAYEVRLPEAIDRGWLLPFHYYGVADETIDFTTIPWRRLSVESQEDLLSIESRVDLVLRSAIERGFDGPKRAAIGFCAGRRHAQFMCDAFRRRGLSAEVVLGDMDVDDRRNIYFRLGHLSDPLEWIFVSDVLNEGVDIPAVNLVLFLRPTDSATIFLQQLGRGLRLSPGVEMLTVIDFVAHDRSAWLAMNALDAPSAGGPSAAVAPGETIRLPTACEVVLDTRTQEILSKVRRFTTNKKEECSSVYRRIREELGRPVLPVDMWNRADCPPLNMFRQAYGSWFECQRAQGDTPQWAMNRQPSDAVLRFLSAVELNWQAQRVTPYALLWGLSTNEDDPLQGYEEFFRRWPHWTIEKADVNPSGGWSTLDRKLGFAITNRSLAAEIRSEIGNALLNEVEGRILYALNQDYADRHGGVLRAPEDLRLWARYSRPEIIRHFGVHYDPAKHNSGMIWIENRGVIITKLDTAGAIERHQYQNRILSPSAFSWTSQNRMSDTNAVGRRLIEHRKSNSTIHLFVQERSHSPAVNLGIVSVDRASGSGPMTVDFKLESRIPETLYRELSSG